MRDREWHVNKFVCGEAEANKFITTSEIMQWCTFAGIEERNVAFHVSFDDEDTSYAESSFFQHVEWNCMQQPTDMTITKITEPRLSAHP